MQESFDSQLLSVDCVFTNFTNTADLTCCNIEFYSYIVNMSRV